MSIFVLPRSVKKNRSAICFIVQKIFIAYKITIGFFFLLKIRILVTRIKLSQFGSFSRKIKISKYTAHIA